jgi:hypothetical protein
LFEKLALVLAFTLIVPSAAMAAKGRARSAETSAAIKKAKSEAKAKIAAAKVDKNKGNDAAARSASRMAAKAKIRQARSAFRAEKRRLLAANKA